MECLKSSSRWYVLLLHFFQGLSDIAVEMCAVVSKRNLFVYSIRYLVTNSIGKLMQINMIGVLFHIPNIIRLYILGS
jgi:hypothetical protein